ncbi:MAG: FAD-dependent oxidoreductase, partial [Pirellulaceae bacterium]|nr:FAD-dependent oxidoreductase [Pirellulaceae bacterium]
MKTTLAGTGAAAIGPLVVPAGAYAGDRVITGKKDATMQTIEYGCDVAVVGGGPGGLAAALAAARQGAKVLLVDRNGLDRNGYLGGNLTMGLPVLGWLDRHQRPVVGGFPIEFIDRLKAMGGSLGVRPCPHHYSVAIIQPCVVKILASDLCAESGVDVLLHSYLTAAEARNGRVTRAFFSCAGNTVEVTAKIFIDGTGDGTLAYLARAACQKGNEKGELQPPSVYYTLGGVDKEKYLAWCEAHGELGAYTMEYLRASPNWCFVTLGKLWQKLQPKGEWPIAVWAFISVNSLNDGELFVNGPRMVGTDATDPRDLTKAERDGARQAVAFTEMLRKHVDGFQKAYISHIQDTLGIRETRRIVGRKMLGVKDALAASVPEDTIALAAYFIDIHSSKDFTSRNTRIDQPFGIPYHCLVSETVDNLMMAGRCISVDNIVFGSTRVMATCMAVGEAAGVGAALA